MIRTTWMGLHWGPAMIAVLLFATCVEAAPRRLFSRRARTYDSSGIKEIAPKSDPASHDYRRLRVFYSYDKALEDAATNTDRLRVYLLVREDEASVLQSETGVVAEVKVTDLSHQQASRLRFCPVSFSPTSTPEYQLATFEVANEQGGEAVIEPAKVYRLFVNLHRKSDRYDRDSVIGQVSSPYYVATSGPDRLDRARQHIAMRTFKEFYYAQQGWRSEENYPMDCYAYYTWATGTCTIGAQNGRAILDRLFGALRPFQSGSQIRQIALQGAIHGDYVRKPGHSFMLLAYDADAGHVWTMEGNFNSTIEVVIRSIDGGWTVGHLVEEHIRPGLFELTNNPMSTMPSL